MIPADMLTLGDTGLLLPKAMALRYGAHRQSPINLRNASISCCPAACSYTSASLPIGHWGHHSSFHSWPCPFCVGRPVAFPSALLNSLMHPNEDVGAQAIEFKQASLSKGISPVFNPVRSALPDHGQSFGLGTGRLMDDPSPAKRSLNTPFLHVEYLSRGRIVREAMSPIPTAVPRNQISPWEDHQPTYSPTQKPLSNKYTSMVSRMALR